jgi:hypothetical protein
VHLGVEESDTRLLVNAEVPSQKLSEDLLRRLKELLVVEEQLERSL